MWHVWVRQCPRCLSLPRQTALRQQCTHLCLLQYFEPPSNFLPARRRCLPQPACTHLCSLQYFPSDLASHPVKRHSLACFWHTVPAVAASLHRLNAPLCRHLALGSGAWRFWPGPFPVNSASRQTTSRAACRPCQSSPILPPVVSFLPAGTAVHHCTICAPKRFIPVDQPHYSEPRAPLPRCAAGRHFPGLPACSCRTKTG